MTARGIAARAAILVAATLGPAAAALLLLSCASGLAGRAGEGPIAPAVDSVTVGLWRMDEPGGFAVLDDGPFRLHASAGAETRTDFGRHRGARLFVRSVDSFLHVPWAPALDVAEAITVEAWIQPAGWSAGEVAPLAARWSPVPNEQSWLFGVVGLNVPGVAGTPPSPGYLQQIVELGSVGHLVFAVQPAEASLPVSYFSSAEIELDRWTHVAATFDGSEVRFYIDGRIDSQFAVTGRIRPSRAPLLVANYFDTKWLTDLGDRPRVGAGVDRHAHYAFVGALDELRISSVARTEFRALH